MAAAAIPIIGSLAKTIFSFLGNKGADSRATTAIANANNTGINLQDLATERGIQGILGSTANETGTARQMGDWWDAILQSSGEGATTYFNNAANHATDQVNASAQAGTQRVDTGASNANDILRGLLQQNTANYQPYAAAGSTAAGNLNSLTGPVTGADRLKNLLDNPASLENTPGYQFQLQQGLQGLSQQAASHGALQSGGVLKALTQYGQGLAGTTYQSAVQNAALSDREEMDKRNQQFSNTLSTANLGMGANSGMESGYLGLGAPQSQNLTNAAQLGAGYGMTAGQFGGNATLSSGQYGGNAMQTTAQERVNTGVDLGKWISDANINAANAAAGLDVSNARSTTPLYQNVGAANAAGILGKASNFKDLLGNAASAAPDIFAELKKVFGG